MTLKPKEQFTIVRQLDNPADTGTYYVQVKIRDPKTDTLLATVNLDDKGGQRFTKPWQVIDDPSGEGRYIDMESSVYTDNTYTTYSDVYAIENKVLLVSERNPINGAGGGGVVDMSADVNYKKIREIVEDVVKGIKPSDKKVNMGGIEAKLANISEQIGNLPTEQETIEFEPVLREIQAIKQAIESLGTAIEQKIDEIPPTEPTDLSPVLSKLEEIDPQSLLDTLQTVAQNMQEFLGGDITKIEQGIKEIKSTFDKIPYVAMYKKETKEVEVEELPEQPRKRNLK